MFRLLLGRRPPRVRGRIGVPGIEARVTIHRDRWGVPHIEAGSDADAWLGLGFCQAQDRMFQLELLRRTATGTLAELVGRDGVASDRLARRLGFVQAAERRLPVLAPEVRAQLEAFARGVTQGARRGARRRAHEFTLLRARPGAWTATDALAVTALLADLLGWNWGTDLARLKVAMTDGVEAVAALECDYPATLPVSAPPGAPAGPALDRLAEDLRTLAATVGGAGSNAWTLAPSRTASGRPLLCGDSHLPPTLPCPWYLAHLRTPRWAIAGSCVAGTSAFSAGHNGFAAWGSTLGLVDNADLFIEEVGPDRRSVREGEGWAPCEVRTERIEVRGADPVVEEVLETSRGPIVGPALEGELGAISLRAVWRDPLPLRGLLDLAGVRSFDDFRAALSDWPAPAVNLVYADAGGAIGWQLAAAAPRRRAGHGTVPRPGWEPRAGWHEELVPFDEMPYVRDPDSGFVATCNNKPVPDGDGPYLGTDWVDGYRIARVTEVLRGRSDWTPEAARDLQLDVTSLPWRALRDIVLAVPMEDGDAARGRDLLAAWDGRVEAGSSGAAVFELLVAELIERVVAAKAPGSARWARGAGLTMLSPHTSFALRRVSHLVGLLSERPDGWLTRSWEEEIADALGAAVRRLAEVAGPDPAGWTWGAVRTLTLRHPVGERRLLRRVFNLGPLPCGGDATTPAQAAVDPLDPFADPLVVAALRVTIDVGAWDSSRFVLYGGQSGNPVSRHYRDQFELWRRGESIPMPWTTEAVARATRTTLALDPLPR